MTVDTTIGWWAVPLALTFAAYAVAIVKIPSAKPSGFLPDMGPAILGFVNLACATNASLAAWLIWAVLT